MLLKRHLRNLLPLLAACVACLAPTSCASLAVGDQDDYVGPLSRPVAMESRVVPDQAGTASPESATRMPDIEPQEGPLEINVEDAVLLALENNREFAVERFAPPIRRTFEQEQRAVFDPVIGGEVSKQRSKSESDTETDIVSGELSLNQFLPTGTTVSLQGNSAATDSSLSSDTSYSTEARLSVTQSILRGFGTGVNLAGLRQARLDTLSSQYELRGFAEALVAETERTYWDFALAQRQMDIFTDSLELAEQQLNETAERIKIGKLAEIELSASQAEVARRRENLINARSILATTHLRLLRLMNPPGANFWDQEIVLTSRPLIPDVEPDDVESHVQVAMRMRPDLNQARLGIQRGDLEIVKTRNGLLPRMDLFVTLGRTGYADSFGDSISKLDDNTYDALIGMSFEYPLGNRDARASHRRAVLSREQAGEALENLVQLVQVDVRSAYIEVNRAREEMAATAATRKFQEETLRAETEKFRVGKSTTFLVAQAQRDLVSSQIAEIQAVASHLKAFVDLYLLEGSLLERRGISAPGHEPLDLLIQKAR